MAADWVSVATAAGSGLFALAGSWLSLKSNRRTEEDRWRRQAAERRDERLQQLYLDMAQHVSATERWIELRTDPVTEWVDPSPSYPIDAALLNPRVELYCDDALVAAWLEYVNLGLAFDEATRMIAHQPVRVFHPSNPAVSRLVGATNATKALLRRAARL